MEIVKYGLLVALAITLVIAAISDIRHRRIENRLNLAIAAAAPAFWWASGLSVWPEMALQFGFALLVCIPLIALWGLGQSLGVIILGGGDVKFLGALALWLTPMAFLDLLLVMAFVGGAIAVGFVVRRVVWKPKTPGTVPYGVAIAVGALWVLGWTYLPQAALAGGLQ
ncbi:MAG: prepilin peptidase [Pseudomonadota bacterium]